MTIAPYILDIRVLAQDRTQIVGAFLQFPSELEALAFYFAVLDRWRRQPSEPAAAASGAS